MKKSVVLAVILALLIFSCSSGGAGGGGGSKGGGGSTTPTNPPVNPPTNPPVDTLVTFSGLTANGNASPTSTTQLTLTFSQAITGLSTDDITLSGTTGATKGTLSGTGPTYTLTIHSFTSSGDLTVTVVKSGYNITNPSRAVPIYYDPANPPVTPPGTPSDITVTFSGLTANGNASTTTTQLTLTFSQAITGLSTNDITFSGTTGATKGTLIGTGPTYILMINNVTSTGDLTVTVVKSGYNIINPSRTVRVYAAPISVTFSNLTANGSTTQTTTELTLTFNQVITGLSANDITLSGVSGVVKGTLSGAGPTYTLSISGFTSSGTLTVAVAKSGYNITNPSRTVPIYYASNTPVPYTPRTPETPINTVKQFWARNLSTGVYYQVTAQLLASNTRCEVWAEQGQGVTTAKAQSVANACGSGANSVYQKLLDGLGSTYTVDVGGRLTSMNTMDWADYLGDGNGKLTILLLDIRDGFNGSGGYTAGYFSHMNFYADLTVSGGITHRSNERDMIYMDTVQAFQYMSESDYFQTLAHETQHMMNSATTWLLFREGKRAGFMETWIDEGLAAAASWIYAGVINTGRIDWYNASSTIPNGNNFFVWDNDLDDYATVNLFFHWLRKQDSANVYKKIFLSEYQNYNAVTKSFKTGTTSWSDLLETWLAANYIKHSSNEYGYKGDASFSAIQARYLSRASSTTPLYPGEGVYTYSSGSTNTGSFPVVTDIKYQGLTTTGVSSTVPAGRALLTYNSNSDRAGTARNGGIIRGSLQSSEARASVLSEPLGPYPVSGVAYALKRNGFPQEAYEIPLNRSSLLYLNRRLSE